MNRPALNGLMNRYNLINKTAINKQNIKYLTYVCPRTKYLLTSPCTPPSSEIVAGLSALCCTRTWRTLENLWFISQHEPLHKLKDTTHGHFNQSIQVIYFTHELSTITIIVLLVHSCFIFSSVPAGSQTHITYAQMRRIWMQKDPKDPFCKLCKRPGLHHHRPPLNFWWQNCFFPCFNVWVTNKFFIYSTQSLEDTELIAVVA